MSLLVPDVSNHQAGLNMTGAPALIAKASQGVGFIDLDYAGFKAQAAALGIPFLGYHYLTDDSIPAQVSNAVQAVGPQQPIMLDIEVDPDTGRWPSMAQAQSFIRLYKAVNGGGRVTLNYLPEWFWHGEWGGPDLTWMLTEHIGLISSNYNPLSGGGGWLPYGGVTPSLWQFTDHYPWGNTFIDMSTYQGDINQLAHLFTEGTTPMTNPINTAEQDCLSILTAMCNGFDTAPVHDKDGVISLAQFWARTGATSTPTGLTEDQVRAIVRAELDRTKLGGM